MTIENMITIRNLNFGTPKRRYDIVCDRNNPTLGNHIGKKLLKRIDQIEAFKSILETDRFKKKIDELCLIYREYGKLNLWCWCAPKPCHTELIKIEILKRLYCPIHIS